MFLMQLTVPSEANKSSTIPKILNLFKLDSFIDKKQELEILAKY